MPFVCLNGELKPDSEPLFPAQNRSFKYGDGLFETAKFFKGRILLAGYHFDRLFTGLRLLMIQAPSSFTEKNLTNGITHLCTVNNCQHLGRVRLAVYRNEANEAAYLIEAIPLLENSNQWQEDGLEICLYPFARKSCDAFANIKSANYLPYVLADLYAKENGIGECLVLNNQNNICDASKANIFLINGREITTPALHQGCVNGVMRRYVIEELKKSGFVVHQKEVSEASLVQADEVFLTNAITGIRWVSRYRDKNYTNTITRTIYQRLFTAMY